MVSFSPFLNHRFIAAHDAVFDRLDLPELLDPILTPVLDPLFNTLSRPHLPSLFSPQSPLKADQDTPEIDDAEIVSWILSTSTDSGALQAAAAGVPSLRIPSSQIASYLDDSAIVRLISLFRDAITIYNTAPTPPLSGVLVKYSDAMLHVLLASQVRVGRDGWVTEKLTDLSWWTSYTECMGMVAQGSSTRLLRELEVHRNMYADIGGTEPDPFTDLSNDNNVPPFYLATMRFRDGSRNSVMDHVLALLTKYSGDSATTGDQLPWNMLSIASYVVYRKHRGALSIVNYSATWDAYTR